MTLPDVNMTSPPTVDIRKVWPRRTKFGQENGQLPMMFRLEPTWVDTTLSISMAVFSLAHSSVAHYRSLGIVTH